MRWKLSVHHEPEIITVSPWELKENKDVEDLNFKFFLVSIQFGK